MDEPSHTRADPPPSDVDRPAGTARFRAGNDHVEAIPADAAHPGADVYGPETGVVRRRDEDDAGAVPVHRPAGDSAGQRTAPSHGTTTADGAAEGAAEGGAADGPARPTGGEPAQDHGAPDRPPVR